jgi:hypothetical protein
VTPRFSLLLFVQDAELFLERALASIFAGAPEDLEVIAVNAGSDDHSQLVLEEWAQDEARLRLLPLMRCTEAEALNTAMLTAQGSYLGFLHTRQVIVPGAWRQLSEWTDEAEVIVHGRPEGRLPSLEFLRRRPPSAWGAWISRRLAMRSTAAFLSSRLADDLSFMCRCVVSTTLVQQRASAWVTPFEPSTEIVALFAAANELGGLFDEASAWKLTDGGRDRLVELIAEEAERLIELAPSRSGRLLVMGRVTRSLRASSSIDAAVALRRLAWRVAKSRGSRLSSAFRRMF